MKSRLNGWQRLWVVASGVLVLNFAWQAYSLVMVRGLEYYQSLLWLAFAPIFLSASLYGIGSLISWVRRGFLAGRSN